jgi:hypothetical protein
VPGERAERRVHRGRANHFAHGTHLPLRLTQLQLGTRTQGARNLGSREGASLGPVARGRTMEGMWL